MLATVTALALFGFAILMLAGMLRTEGRKMFDALRGQSWTARQSSIPPVTVRFSPRYPASRQIRVTLALRAAA